MAKLVKLSQYIPACDNIDFVYLTERKSYVAFTTPIFEHTLSNQQMSAKAKLFYLLVYCLTSISAKKNKKKYGQRNIAKTYQEWLKLLGWSRTTFFNIKLELQNLGYLKEAGETIIPMLPDLVFAELNLSPNRYNADLGEYLCNIKCLDASKQFIKINLSLLKQLLLEPYINDQDKLLWLHCFKRSYLSCLDKNGEGDRAFLVQQHELADFFSLGKSNISRSLLRLVKAGYINKKHFKKLMIIDNEGREIFCSAYQLEAKLPLAKMSQLKSQPDRAGLYDLSTEQQFEYGLTKERPPRDLSYDDESLNKHSRMSNSGLSVANSGIVIANSELSVANSEPTPYYNKDHISNNSIRGPNADRQLDKNAAMSRQGKIFQDRRSQVTETSLPEITPVLASKIIPEQEVATNPVPIDKEKISQLLQAARENLALIKSKEKVTADLIATAAPSLPDLEKSLAMQINTLAPVATELYKPLKSSNKATRGVILVDELSMVPDVEITPIKALNEALTVELIKQSTNPSKLSNEANFMQDNIIEFPNLSIEEDEEFVPDAKKTKHEEWENPLHYYIYADLYQAICKDLSARNEEHAVDYAMSLSKRFPERYKFWDSLYYEFKYYAGSYKPRDFISRDREKIALVNARKLVADGKWETPRALARIASLSREAQHHVEKYLEMNKRAITADMQEVFDEISRITGKPCLLEDLCKRYQQEEKSGGK